MILVPDIIWVELSNPDAIVVPNKCEQICQYYKFELIDYTNALYVMASDRAFESKYTDTHLV